MKTEDIKELHDKLKIQWNELDAIVKVTEDGSVAQKIAMRERDLKQGVMNELQKYLPYTGTVLTKEQALNQE